MLFRNDTLTRLSLATFEGGGIRDGTSTRNLVKVKKGVTFQSLPNGIATPIIYDEIEYNDDLQYDPLTGITTVESSGDYMVTSSITTIGSWLEGQRQVFELHLNGLLHTYLDSHQYSSDAEFFITQSTGTDIVRLNRGDTIQVLVYHDADEDITTVVNGQGQFAGELNYISIAKLHDAPRVTAEELIELPSLPDPTYFYAENEIVVHFITGHYPDIQVFIYDSEVPMPALNLSVTDVANQVFSGLYNQVGYLCVGGDNTWTLNSEHALFKSNTSNNYIAFYKPTSSWIIFESLNDHNNIGSQAFSEYVTLNQNGTLPTSYSSYQIETNLESLDTTNLVQASPKIVLDQIGKKITLSFGSISQTGMIVYK